LRADDVPNAIAREEQGGSELFLSVPSDITAYHSKTQGEAEALEVAKPESDETTPFVVGGESDEEGGADDADGVGDNHGETAGVVGEFGADVAAEEEGEELDVGRLSP
jgi:hypothetical protein